jgi:hypothetical protein
MSNVWGEGSLGVDCRERQAPQERGSLEFREMAEQAALWVTWAMADWLPGLWGLDVKGCTAREVVGGRG